MKVVAQGFLDNKTTLGSLPAGTVFKYLGGRRAYVKLGAHHGRLENFFNSAHGSGVCLVAELETGNTYSTEQDKEVIALNAKVVVEGYLRNSPIC